MMVSISNNQKIWGLKSSLIESAVAAAFKAAGRMRSYNSKQMAFSVVIVDDRQIASINKRFLGRARPTDVIAFEFTDGGAPRRGEYWGEVIISAQTAKRVAKELCVPIESEIALYVIHGTLHLLGYDDLCKRDSELMRMKERVALKALSL